MAGPFFGQPPPHIPGLISAIEPRGVRHIKFRQPSRVHRGKVRQIQRLPAKAPRLD
jgi:hypothetical protein